MAEQTMVDLVHGNETRPFKIKSAERLLQLQEKKKLPEKVRWAIAPKQPFEFKDGVISPTGKGQNTNTGQ